MVMRSAKGARKPKDRLGLQGLVEIEVHRAGKLVQYIREKNVILYQGDAEVIRTISTVSPSTEPRIIDRMCIGDLGTIPADSTIPQPVDKSDTALYHETYRKNIDSRILTIAPAGFTTSMLGTLVFGSAVVTVTSTVGIALGMAVSGTGVNPGTVVFSVNSSTQFTLSSSATVSSPETLTLSGAANECRYIATFNATDVALSAYANPNQPRVNEVGLVFINPSIQPPGSRVAVTAPATPLADEVIMSHRTFKSVPFEIANDASITIRYTIYMA